MASFKYLIFVALAVYAVSAEESNTSEDGVRVKKHAYVASVHAPVWAYSAPAPYYPHKPYTHSVYRSYPAYKYPAVSYASVRSYNTYPAKPYVTYAAHPPSYVHHGGKYWHGKYHY